MKLDDSTDRRCAECGGEFDRMVRFDRAGPFCRRCIECARDMLVPPLTLDEVRRLRKLLEPAMGYVPLAEFFGKEFDEAAYRERIARRMANPNDDLVTGKKLP